MAAEALSPAFVDGFVQFCYDQGLTLDETETLFRKQANARYLAQPHIYEGFRTMLQRAAELGLTKAAMAKYLTPDILALAVDCRVKYGADVLSTGMRAEMGLPEPSWETVAPELQKIASALGQRLAGFQSLPLQQQILISALVGSGVGGLKRLLLPNAEDQAEGRGMINRTLHGAVRGGATGAGAGLGASFGGRWGMPGTLAGAAAGGLAGNQLGKLVAG